MYTADLNLLVLGSLNIFGYERNLSTSSSYTKSESKECSGWNCDLQHGECCC